MRKDFNVIGFHLSAYLNTRQHAICSVYILLFKSYDNHVASTIIILTAQMREMRLRKDKLLSQNLAEQNSNLGCQITEYKLLTYTMYCLPF